MKNLLAEAYLKCFCIFYDYSFNENDGDKELRILELANEDGLFITEDDDVAELWHISKDGIIICSKFTSEETCSYEFSNEKLEEL